MHAPSADDRSIAVAGRRRSTEHLDHLLARLAHNQGGAVGRVQLINHGVGEAVIDRRLRSGHLHALPSAAAR